MTRRDLIPRGNTLVRSLLLAVVLLACAALLAEADYQVSGRFLYRDREFGLSGFTGVEPNLPIRLADVQVVDATNKAILAAGATDNDGFFTLYVADQSVRDVTVRVLSSTSNTPGLFISVIALQNALYAVAHPVLTSHDPTANIDFTTAPVIAVQGSGGDAFNILDVTLDAMNLVAALRGSWPGASQSLRLGWYQGNRSGTYYQPNIRFIYLLGTSADSDAYDDSVILHEIGHYVESVFADSDNPGGRHSLNGCYDLRLAWSEGWSTFFQNMERRWKGLNRPEIYVDTTGHPGPGGAFLSNEVEGPGLGIPGSGNEVAVNAALWEIIDDEATPDATPGIDDDLLQIADGPERIWEVMTHYIRTAQTISVEDFWDGWLEGGHGFSVEMEEAFSPHGMEFFRDGFEPDDDRSQARVLCSSGTSHHTIFGMGDADWTRIGVAVGSVYSFQTANVPCGSRTQLALYASDGTVLTVGTGVGESQISWVAPFPGDVYLRCTRLPDVHSYSSYDLVVTGPVIDTAPPTISVTLNRDVLWPPNHGLSNIEATIAVGDACDPAPRFVLMGIESSDPDNGIGDGDTVNDIQGADIGTPDVEFELRSERSGQGSGRIYTLTYAVIDGSGNSDSVDVLVRVPHDRSGEALAAGGFLPDGTGLVPGVGTFVLVVPSLGQVPELSKLRGSRTDVRAFVGNHLAQIPALSSLVLDVTGDRLEDLVLEYSAKATLDLAALGQEPVAFRYEDGAGAGYLVPDIFALGPPITLPGRQGPPEELENHRVLPVPQRTALVAIRPNPFNPSTTVSFDLATAGPARVEIYDPRGFLVRTLRNQTLPVGRYEVTWDGRNQQGRAVSTGVYFMRLVTSDVTQVRKAILMK